MTTEAPGATRENVTEKKDSATNKYLTFVLGREIYGVEIEYVNEIIGLQKITPVPDLPDYIKGVINLRGKVIPVMDIRLRFRMNPRDYDDRTCTIVVNIQETTVGLIVDTVCEVLEIAENRIEPPHGNKEGHGNQFMKGLAKVGEKIKILLNVHSLLFKDAGHLKRQESEDHGDDDF